MLFYRSTNDKVGVNKDLQVNNSNENEEIKGKL